jgi:hypothetical protein
MRQVQPAYPPLAKFARVQGVVEFTATISKEGKIENLQLVRGHPLLVNCQGGRFAVEVPANVAQRSIRGSSDRYRGQLHAESLIPYLSDFNGLRAG